MTFWHQQENVSCVSEMQIINNSFVHNPQINNILNIC